MTTPTGLTRYWCWDYELRYEGSMVGTEYTGHNQPKEVYLAADVAKRDAEIVSAMKHWRDTNHPIGKCICAECDEAQRLLALLEGTP